MIGLLFAAALAINPQQWPIGTEREVDEGVYMQVAAAQHGWRVWRIETKDGVRCQGVKSGRGQPHPAPVGVGSAYYGGTPYLLIAPSRQAEGFDYYWYARHHGRVRLKYRLVGDRFWTEPGPLEFDPVAIGERPIEVVVTSWEYPEILVGYSEESAVFDLTGLAWAQEQVRSCQSVT